LAVKSHSQGRSGSADILDAFAVIDTFAVLGLPVDLGYELSVDYHLLNLHYKLHRIGNQMKLWPCCKSLRRSQRICCVHGGCSQAIDALNQNFEYPKRCVVYIFPPFET
jgi:hypothetical protein